MSQPINEILKSYKFDFSNIYIENEIDTILKKTSEFLFKQEFLVQILNCIDLTSLNAGDHISQIKKMALKVSQFEQNFPDYNNIAAICVYPNFIETVKQNLTIGNVNIASVAGVFPSSQSFFEIKQKECEMALEKGADELDIVIPVGSLLAGAYQRVYNEIVAIKAICGDAHLKVILETGELKTVQNIYVASIIALEAGADFIKTSTGKVPINATHEAAYLMCHAIKRYYQKTDRKAGFKVAGGVSTTKTAIEYYAIAKHILGNEWMNKRLFRIGTSSLVNKLLTSLERLNGKESAEVKYF